MNPDTLQYIKLCLLVSAILLFIIVGYKRLLRKFGKGDIIPTSFLHDIEYDAEHDKIVFKYELPVQLKITLTLLDNESNKMLDLIVNQPTAKGIHQLSVNKSEIPKEVGYYRLVTSYQKVTKKFISETRF